MKHLTLAHLTVGATPLETVEAACVAGFGQVGLRICARRPGDAFATPVIGDAALIRKLRDRAAIDGVGISNISAYQFYPDVTWDQLAPAVDTAHALGARILVVNGFDANLERFVERLARYAEAAAAANLRIALEFLPYSAVKTLQQALELVERTGASNAGLLLDVLHLDRSGGTAADLAGLAAERIVFAQLCDALRLAHRASDAELMQEARTARLPAGRGELPLDDFLDALPDGIEIEYEVARADLHEHTAVQKAQAASADAQAFMNRYWQRRDGRGSAGQEAMPSFTPGGLPAACLASPGARHD